MFEFLIAGNRNVAKYTSKNFRCVRKIAKFVISVSPHGITRFLLNGFSLNLVFEYISKICRQNSILIKIWRE
jgi:hypothetical protein